LIKLSDCKVGDQVTLSALANSSEEFLKYLNSKQLQLEIKLRVEAIEPFDQSMKIKYLRNRVEILSQMACNKLLVEKHLKV
jgi:DtxR family transcriptional regulator, Mn-dependent transcriptional regulator